MADEYKYYEFEVDATVRKLITVEARNEREALAAAKELDWWNEQDMEIIDYEIVKGPEEVE